MGNESSVKEYVEKMEKRFDERLQEMEKVVNDLRVKIAWFSGLGSAVGIILGHLISYFFKNF